MFTGREALSSVERAISSVRASESRLDATLRSAVDEAARLRVEKAEGFRALARIRLDAIMREQVIQNLDATERRALSMLEQHRQRLADLSRRRDAGQAALERAEAAKHERDGELAEALEELETLRERTLAPLQTSSEWKEAQTALEAAVAIAESAEKKAALAQEDLAAKGAPYETDPLFMYLWEKKHGTTDDTSGALVRYFDRKVAALVGFRDARANYAMLKEIPVRLAEHAESRRAAVESARQRVADVERQALVASGIQALETKAAESEGAVTAAAEEVVRITADLRQVDAEREELLRSGDDTVFGRAVNLLADALSREDIRNLYEEARRTPSPADDRVVSSISSLDAALVKADEEVVQIRSEIREMARRRTELEGARDRARNSGYDDPRGTFGGNGQEVIGEIIGGILRGALRGGALDQVFGDTYRAPRRRGGARWGDSSGPPSWPSPWGGGGNGGAPGGGRADDSDSGWRTGGSF
jgi:chromosome segregation ATPase